MPFRQALLNEIRVALGTQVSPQLGSASAADDIFEAYVWALVIDAARNEGASIRYRDIMNRSAASLVFRTSPGAVYSTANPYSYAQLNFTGCPSLEAHLGIFVSGKSGVPHECDVAVIYASEADTCRQGQVHPRSTKLILSVECKFYSTNLRIDLARSFLGLTEEIQQRDRFFVSNASSGSVTKMLTSHDRNWETRVDLELATQDYREPGLAEKSKAGFSIYAPGNEADRLRAAIKDPELTREILNL